MNTDLDPNSPTGCTKCTCNVAGSMAVPCDKQTSVCVCKKNVEGNDCDTCKFGFTGALLQSTYLGFMFLITMLRHNHLPKCCYDYIYFIFFFAVILFLVKKSTFIKNIT